MGKSADKIWENYKCEGQMDIYEFLPDENSHIGNIEKEIILQKVTSEEYFIGISCDDMFKIIHNENEIGHICINEYADKDKYIEWVYIKEEYRHKGYVRDIFLTTMKHYNTDNLVFGTNNELLPMYEHLGAMPSNTEYNYELTNKEHREMVITKESLEKLDMNLIYFDTGIVFSIEKEYAPASFHGSSLTHIPFEVGMNTPWGKCVDIKDFSSKDRGKPADFENFEGKFVFAIDYTNDMDEDADYTVYFESESFLKCKAAYDKADTVMSEYGRIFSTDELIEEIEQQCDVNLVSIVPEFEVKDWLDKIENPDPVMIKKGKSR